MQGGLNTYQNSTFSGCLTYGKSDLNARRNFLDEIKGEGNSVNYKYRMHDPRIGRFFAVDPLSADYPHNSPYAFSENSVIACVELEGLEMYFAADGSYLGKTGTDRTIRVVQQKDVIEAVKHINWSNDPSDHGKKYATKNRAAANNLSKVYHLAGKTEQEKVSSTIYRVWVQTNIPLISITAVTDDDSKLASTNYGETGKFDIVTDATYTNGVYAQDNFYDQLSRLYHEEQHNQFNKEGKFASGYGFGHFLVDKKVMSFWAYPLTTQGNKDHMEYKFGLYLDQELKSIEASDAGSEARGSMVAQHNKDVEWYNKTFGKERSGYVDKE